MYMYMYNYVHALSQMEEVQQRLNSAVHSLVEQLECLKNQVNKQTWATCCIIIIHVHIWTFPVN